MNLNLEREKNQVYAAVTQHLGLVLQEGGTYLPMAPKDAFNKLKSARACLCGGAILSIITGKPIKDLDIYCMGEDGHLIIEQLMQECGFEMTFQNENANTYVRKQPGSRKLWKVQLIKRFTGAPSDIFSSFDFTVTTGAYDFLFDQFEFGEFFWRDVAARKLVYMGGSRYPICAIWRSKKYQEKGFHLPGSTLMHMALAIVQLEIKTYADLKYQLMGIDTMYLQNLLDTKYKDKMNAPVDYGMFIEDAFDAIYGEALNLDEDTD